MRPGKLLRLAGSVVLMGTLTQGARGEGEGCPLTAQLLREGKETVRIVCFGDSITGVYYHSGAARAWCDMVGIGLRQLYPQAKVEMINAGISSQTSGHGLARLAKDVLERKPTLVVVAFGMNDVRANEKRGIKPLPTQQAHDNQAQIVKLCKAAGSEVVLCTPTSVYHGYEEWPFELLAPYAEMIRQVAAEEKVPVADSYRAFEDTRAKDATAWMLLMSEWIHPSMNGHKVIAQGVIRAATGQSVTLADVPAPVPGIPFTLAKLAKGEPVKVMAMEPVDKIIVQALQGIYPNAQVTVVPWAVPDLSLEKISESAGGIRAQKVDLVVVAVPATATAKDEEWFIRNYSNLYGSSVSYVTREFDSIGILPAVFTPDLDPANRRRQDLARAVIRGLDLDPLERKTGDTSTPEQILTRWLQQQAQAEKK
jgi:lysophospholipase L1-like esterase